MTFNLELPPPPNAASSDWSSPSNTAVPSCSSVPLQIKVWSVLFLPWYEWLVHIEHLHVTHHKLTTHRPRSVALWGKDTLLCLTNMGLAKRGHSCCAFIYQFFFSFHFHLISSSCMYFPGVCYRLVSTPPLPPPPHGRWFIMTTATLVTVSWL